MYVYAKAHLVTNFFFFILFLLSALNSSVRAEGGWVQLQETLVPDMLHLPLGTAGAAQPAAILGAVYLVFGDRNSFWGKEWNLM